ncbi:MAG: ABC-F family ATP-binding cassette domain-containing protein [Patescibacteria group bacterium]|mgnify:CR=1 FL=1
MPRPLLEIKHLNKEYGRQIVLDDVSFNISEGQKIALIGRNGAGKSTLLSIITSALEADSGEVTLLPWTRMGTVTQHEALPADVTAEAYLEEKCGKQSWEIAKLAARFGLSATELAMPPSALSGGYQMRVKLIAMLLMDPNLLLLDEPVNYLDVPTQMLLERFLQTFDGSFILTSHDREFLQNTCTDTIEVERAKITQFPGGVEEFLVWKEEQRELLLKNNKRLSREIAHTQVFVDRFRYKASLATRAQSKIRHIAKLRRELRTINDALATARISIPCPPLPGGIAIRCENISVGYNGHAVVKDITFEVERGQKAVIAGENGRGKSTLLKTIYDKIPAISGNIKWWHRSDIGYFDQDTAATLVPDETVLNYLSRMAPPDASAERLLMMAGNFLFRNDDLEKTSKVLSGGERARLCLAGLLLGEHNTLLLDEPTNHLDVETAETLAEALKEYNGTVIFVSHARTFVNALADRVFEIRGGTMRTYHGTYEEYIGDLSAMADEEAGAPVAKEDDGKSNAERRALIKEKRRKVSRLEEEVKALETEKSAILAYYFENPTDYAPDKAERLAQIGDELADLERRWLELQEDIEKAAHA